MAPVHGIDRFQQERKPLAVLVATIKKFGDDEAGSFAVVVAFWAFFCVFPLLLVFVTILGYVLAGDKSLLHSVENSVLGQFPVIGDQIKNNKLEGSAVALIVGVLLSLWSGLSVTTATQTAFDHVWGIPKKAREGFVKTKLRGAALLAALGLMFVIASGASGVVVTSGVGGPLLLVVGIVLSIALNVALFLASFKLLCSDDLELRTLLPGALVAAVLWEILQVVGAGYIRHFGKGNNNAYGTFAVVLGVLAWLHLGSQMMVYCNEFNSVLAKKAWPRKLMGD